jgi:hypothetical protein
MKQDLPQVLARMYANNRGMWMISVARISESVAARYGALPATTPMLATVSPFFIEGTAQTYRTTPLDGARASHTVLPNRAYVHYVNECKTLQNPRLTGRPLVVAFVNSEVLKSSRQGLRENWGSARDTFPDMSREGAKSAQRYFSDLRADQGKPSSGC